MYVDQFMGRIFRVFLFSLFLLNNCGSLQAADEGLDFLDDAFYEEAAAENAVNDPFEGMNRVVFTLNDYAFIWILNPLATGYSRLLPADLRGSIENFFYNLQYRRTQLTR